MGLIAGFSNSCSSALVAPMSESLDFFGLDRPPFADEAPASVVIGTRALRKVVSRIQATLRDGGTRIGVLGASGIGKTSLARALPKLFAGSTRVATIFDPSEDWKTLRATIAREWQLGGEKLARASLLTATRVHRLVLVVDGAESASDALLRHLEALQAIEGIKGGAAVSVVLFVRSDRDTEGPRPGVLDWLERSHAALIPFEPLAPEVVADFIERQLQRAGHRGNPIFTPRAALAIHGETHGVPGAIGRLCDRLLADAAARRLRTIDEPFVRSHGAPRPARADDIAGASEFDAEDEVAWDDADHHPRETPGAELLLEHAISPPRPTTSAVRATAAASTSGPGEEALGDPELEAYLSAPPTAAELRAIRGGFLRRHLWPFAAVSAAAIFGGLLLARFSSDAPIAAPASTAGAVLAQPDPAGLANDASPRVLGRLRGPVATGPTNAMHASQPAPRVADGPIVQNASPLRRAGELDDARLPPIRRTLAARAAEADPIELGDMHPKDLPPPASLESALP